MQLTPYQRDILIRTVAGEAMSESPAGQAAVVHTILNRAADGRWPTDPAKVALQPQQFSAWNKGAGGNALPYTIKPGSAAYEAIGQLVDGAASGAIADPTGGAVFYYAPKGMAGGKKPSWYGSANREGPARRLGNHIFLGRTGAAAKTGNLVRGMGSSKKPDPKVRALQEQLIAAGYDLGNAGADGVFGKRTEQAVFAYNAKYGLAGGTTATADTLRSLAATATPTISPAGLYPPPQTEPPPVWPDSFNPPSGLNVGNAFPDTAAPFPGLPPLAPGSAPIAPMAPPVPTAGPMPFDPAQMTPDQGANIRGDFSQPSISPDMAPAMVSDTLARMIGPDAAPPMQEAPASTFPARPEFPGALPGAAPPPPGALPPGFAAAMGDYRQMMPDALTRSIDATTRRKAAMDQAMAAGAGQRLPDFGFATAPTPPGQDAVRPPPWSDRALMMGPPVREDITTANSPFAAGLDALPATRGLAPPRSPDFDFTAGAGGDPSLAQWLERNGPNAPKATAGGGPLDFLSGILPEQNLLRDLGLMSGGNNATASTPPATRALPPPAAPPPGVWDPFNTRDYGKDQSRHPAMMGPGASLSPMGATRIPAPVMVADASGAWPQLTPVPTDLSTANSPNTAMTLPALPAPPPSTFPARPGIPGALPAARPAAPPSLPGVTTFAGPPGGIPIADLPPLDIRPPVAAVTPASLAPAPAGVMPEAPEAPTKRPGARSPARIGAGIGGILLGPVGGVVGGLIGRSLNPGAPGTDLFSALGSSTSPGGTTTTYGTWSNGMPAVRGSNGQTYVQMSDGTYAQALRRGGRAIVRARS